MKVSAYDINMTMNHEMVTTDTSSERMRLWTGSPGQARGRTGLAAGRLPEMADDVLSLSTGGKNRMLRDTSRIDGTLCPDLEKGVMNEKDRCKILLLQKFMEALTGKKFRFYVFDGTKLKQTEPGSSMAAAVSAGPGSALGWGFEYDLEITQYERETVAFASNGVIKTGDGRTINFNVELIMSREFASRTGLSIRAGDAVNMADPLILSLDGTAPKLSGTTFHFDLDLDGNNDEICFAGGGSGFLALDRNGDGIINDGSELFGPSIGNGFLELAEYDSDDNNWIDENDPIFDRLRIWTRDEDGSNRLLALGAHGIGAIYLGNISTPFQFKNVANQLQGQMASSGIFLNENGTAGTIHHIDLAL